MARGEEFLPRMHVIVSALSQGAQKTGIWDAWRLLPDCPMCIGGLSYAARYEDDTLMGGNHVWCQCQKGVKHPQYNALHYKKWDQMEAIKKEQGIDVRFIPKDSDEFMADVRKILRKDKSIEFLDAYGSREIPIPF
jgi:hypothetical protein